MQYLKRPFQFAQEVGRLGPGTLLAVLLAASISPSHAQSSDVTGFFDRLHPFVSHSSSQGYLGVLVADVDNDSFTRLRLTDRRGAMITLIDHDAPAGQNGLLRVNDVVLSINGQNIENSIEFGRMLREFPVGRTVSMVIVRDGDTRTVAVKLEDRREIERRAWPRYEGGASAAPPVVKTLLPGDNGTNAGSPMHLPFIGRSELHVGALVEPLTGQMADYLGVPYGMLIKQIARKSEAEAAGLKEYDVIIRVGTDPVKTISDWERSLRENEGHQVQVTILRDRRQQALNLQVDSKKPRR